MDHHPTYDSFINAVVKGCYICVLLWERIPPDAKRALPTLCSDYVLLKCNYFMQQNDKSQVKLVKSTQIQHMTSLCARRELMLLWFRWKVYPPMVRRDLVQSLFYVS